MKKHRKIIIRAVIAVLLLAGIFGLQLPYFITMPGSARELSPFVQVEGGDDSEGELMLVTVSMARATPFTYLLAGFQDYHKIFPKRAILGDSTSEEYNFLQSQLMLNSQQNAISVAYEKAGKEWTSINKGVIVLDVGEDTPAENIVRVGDIITEIDGNKLVTTEEFIDFLSDKEAEEVVSLTINRGENTITEEVTLQPLANDESRVGLGVQIQTVRDLETNPEIEINVARIGGPSAGLMFSLEIYDQLTEGDLAKGHRIVGTGTIDAEGVVGEIGGVAQKVVAAHQEGADFFFAPNPEKEGENDYQIAQATARAIGTDMKIIPVATIDDALGFLYRLEERIVMN